MGFADPTYFILMLIFHLDTSGLVCVPALSSVLFGVDSKNYSGHVRHVLVEKARHSSCRFVRIHATPQPYASAHLTYSGDLGVQRGVIRWFLSLHSPANPITLSPKSFPKHPVTCRTTKTCLRRAIRHQPVTRNQMMPCSLLAAYLQQNWTYRPFRLSW